MYEDFQTGLWPSVFANFRCPSITLGELAIRRDCTIESGPEAQEANEHLSLLGARTALVLLRQQQNYEHSVNVAADLKKTGQRSTYYQSGLIMRRRLNANEQQQMRDKLGLVGLKRQNGTKSTKLGGLMTLSGEIVAYGSGARMYGHRLVRRD